MGQFQKGQPKPTGSGRKKGTPNQKTLILRSLTEELELNVPSRIASLLPNLCPEKQIDVLLELMSYLYPKRKPADSPPSASVSGYSCEGMTPEEIDREIREIEALARRVRPAT